MISSPSGWILVTVAPFPVAVAASTERNTTCQPIDPMDFDVPDPRSPSVEKYVSSVANRE